MYIFRGCLNIQIDVWPGLEILNQNSYSSHDLKVSSQVCTVNNTSLSIMGGGSGGLCGGGKVLVYWLVSWTLRQ